MEEKDIKRSIKQIKEKIQQGFDNYDPWELNPQVLQYSDKMTGACLIHYACEFSNVNFLLKIKLYHGQCFLFQQLKQPTHSGRTAIHFAFQSACEKLCGIILKILNRESQDELNYQLNLTDNKNRNSPLHLLLLNQRQKSKQEVILNEILELSEDLQKYTDLNGNGLLHLAYQTNNFNQTAFQIAFEGGNMEICDLMTNFLTNQKLGDIDDKDSYLKNSEQVQLKYLCTTDINQSEREDKKLFKEVFVHLDFKGAPPTFSYMKKFIQFMGERYQKLVTGFVLEFEDTFPYEGHLTSLRGVNFYTKEQVIDIIQLMRKFNFKIIPLIQTFGHLEFVLKRERFAHLRESPDSYQSICPLKKESKSFVLNMIEQNVKLIGEQNLQYMHLGADEVFNLGSCQECQFFSEEAGKSALYSSFVMKICKSVKKRYPNIQLIIWDDMFRNYSYRDFQTLKTNNTPIFEPCIWSYPGNQDYFQNTIKPQSFNNLCLEFKNVWAASCYKGSCEPSTTMTDFSERLYNHKNWIDRIRPSPFQNSVKGIILTGWARFSHETVLCELLCMSIPSICMCLAVVERQNLNLNVLYKESVAHLNLKGKTLLNGVNDILNNKSLQEFLQCSPFIDEKREPYFCHDAFEICWNISKAHCLLKMTKKNLKDCSVLNHDKIMQRQNEFVIEQYEKLRDKCRTIQQNDSMSIDSSNFDSFSHDEYSSDSLNCERMNPSTRSKIVDYLRGSIKLLKKSVIMADKILPNYMFSRDIEEFKNSKILKYLHSAFLLLEGLTERTRSQIQFHHKLNQVQNKRLSQTPNMTTSPLLQPFKPQITASDAKQMILFPRLNDALIKLDKITSLNDAPSTLHKPRKNMYQDDTIQATSSEFKVPLPRLKKHRIPQKLYQLSSPSQQILTKLKSETITNNLSQADNLPDSLQPFTSANFTQNLTSGTSDERSLSNVSLASSLQSEEEKSTQRKRERKILRKRTVPKGNSKDDRSINLIKQNLLRNKKARISDGKNTEEQKQE